MNYKELAINLLLIQGKNCPQKGTKKVEKEASVLNFIHYVSKLNIIFFKSFTVSYALSTFRNRNLREPRLKIVLLRNY